MEEVYFSRNILQADTADTAYCICKIFVNNIFINTDRLKNLGALIGLDRRYAHLRGNFYDTVKHSVIVIVDRRIVILIQHIGINQLLDRFLGKIRIDG